MSTSIGGKLSFHVEKAEDNFYAQENSVNRVFSREPYLFHLVTKELLVYTDDVIFFYYKMGLVSSIFSQFFKEEKIYRFMLYEEKKSWNPIQTFYKRYSPERKGDYFSTEQLTKR